MARRDRRLEVMQAAEALFTSRRYHEITTDDIAKAARVGKGTIYRYFADKDALFFQVALSGFDELCDLLQRKVPERAPFAEQLLRACGEITRFFDHRRQLFRMMLAEENRMHARRVPLRERWLERRKKLVAAVSIIIQEGVEERQIRPDVQCDVLANYLLGMLRTRARDLEDAPEPMRRLELIIELFLGGAGGARVPGRPGGASG
jgi:AcrR family transcriptional regulator